MKFTIRGMLVAAGLLGSAAFVFSQAPQLPADEILLRAMRDEMARLPQLAKVGGMDAPYYTSYTVSDADSFNVSSTLGAVVAARFVQRDLSRLLTVCGMAGLVFGAGYLALSASNVLALGLVFVCIAHMGGGAQWTMSTYGLQIRSPDEVRGRIMAIVRVGMAVVWIAASLVGGRAVTSRNANVSRSGNVWPPSVSMRSASLRAASTNCLSFIKTSACSGVFVR